MSHGRLEQGGVKPLGLLGGGARSPGGWWGYFLGILAAFSGFGEGVLGGQEAGVVVEGVSAVESLRTTRADVHYRVPEGLRGQLARVGLWYSRGEAGRWVFYGYDEDLASPIGFTAEVEGLYRLLVGAVDKQGRHWWLDPRGNCMPQEQGGVVPGRVGASTTVFMDSTSPRLYLYSPRGGESQVPGQIELRWVTVDQHLGKGPVRLYYHCQGSRDWVLIGEGLPSRGHCGWEYPAGLCGSVIIKAVAVDRVGNEDVQFSGVVKIGRPEQAAGVEGEQADSGASGSGEASDSAGEAVAERSGLGASAAGVEGAAAAGREARVEPSAAVRAARAKAALSYRRARLHCERNEYEAAVKAFEEALVADPGWMAARLNLADVHFRQGRFSEAQGEYGRCLSQDPGQESALFGLAKTQMTLGSYGEAETTLARLLGLDGGDCLVWLMHGDVCGELGEREAAARSWRRAGVAGSPVRAEALERLGRYGR